MTFASTGQIINDSSTKKRSGRWFISAEDNNGRRPRARGSIANKLLIRSERFRPFRARAGRELVIHFARVRTNAKYVRNIGEFACVPPKNVCGLSEAFPLLNIASITCSVVEEIPCVSSSSSMLNAFPQMVFADVSNEHSLFSSENVCKTVWQHYYIIFCKLD